MFCVSLCVCVLVCVLVLECRSQAAAKSSRWKTRKGRSLRRAGSRVGPPSSAEAQFSVSQCILGPLGFDGVGLCLGAAVGTSRWYCLVFRGAHGYSYTYSCDCLPAMCLCVNILKWECVIYNYIGKMKNRKHFPTKEFTLVARMEWHTSDRTRQCRLPGSW